MVIGLSDPDKTGLLFGGLGLLMMVWPGRYKITPDFENEVFEGRIKVKGFVSVLLVIIYAVKLLLFFKSDKKEKTEKGV